MGALKELYDRTYRAPEFLWQLKSFETNPEQRAERELAIRNKAQELATRNNEVEGAISLISEVLGIMKAPDTIPGSGYSTGQVQLPPNPQTGSKLSATFGKHPNGSAWVRYYDVDAEGKQSEIPRSARYHTSTFDVEDTTSLSLALQYGTFTWENDCLDYDNARVEILELAESVVGAWEKITDMLLQAMRDPALNPDAAALLVQNDAEARQREEAAAAFLGGMNKI